MTTKEIFVQEVDRLWKELKDRDDTIFENVGIQIDTDEKYNSLVENNTALHMKFVQESSLYEKKKLIRTYFWDEIVGELYENTIGIMKEAGILEEALDSFEKSYKIENTAKLILENGIFAEFTSGKKKELTENVIEMCFYPASYYESHLDLMDDLTLEEGWVKPMIQWGGERVRDVARILKSIHTTLVYLLVSPATFLVGGTTARVGDALLNWYEGGGRAPSGIDPSLRKFYSLVDSFSPVNMLFKFMNKDLYDVSTLLKKTNNLEDDYLQDVMREMKSDPNKLIKKCWDKNKYQTPSANPNEPTIADGLKHFFSGKWGANQLRDPFYNNETQIAHILQKDAADPKFQKMFFDFRVCIYEKLFEIILGYAKTIYSMDDASYEIIKAANDAHKSKNFKSFFDIRPKQVNEEAMFKIMRALVSIDSIASSLDARKGELVADKYVDRFSDFLRQNVKQVYNELNEMANQKKYNQDRYSEEEPDDEAKAKIIQKERFDAKKSIFQD